jgi:hypothetical protein
VQIGSSVFSIQFSNMKRIFQGALISLSTLCILFLILEVASQRAGYKAFVPGTFQMRGTKMEPRPLFNPDTLVGIKLDSGTYKIYYEDGTFWQATNDQNGNRITSNKPLPNEKNIRSHIDIFGCSFSYGTGLADSQTYPFLLQQRLMGMIVNNIAVPGQGVAANFVKITKQTLIDSNSIIIYAYIDGYDFKTNHANEKQMYPSRLFLKDYYFLYLTETLQVVKEKYSYKPWPLIDYSAFLNYLEDRYINILDDNTTKHLASKKAVTYIDDLCRKNKARFIFAILTNDNLSTDMLSYCRQNHIDCVDLSVNIADPRYNLRPYDDHPNYKANKLYCAKLFNYLKGQGIIRGDAI